MRIITDSNPEDCREDPTCLAGPKQLLDKDDEKMGRIRADGGAIAVQVVVVEEAALLWEHGSSTNSQTAGLLNPWSPAPRRTLAKLLAPNPVITDPIPGTQCMNGGS